MSHLSLKEIQTTATQLINKLDSALAKITDVSIAVRQLDVALGNFYSQITAIIILNLVAPDKRVREQSQQIALQVEKALLSVFGNERLAKLIMIAADQKSTKPDQTPESLLLRAAIQYKRLFVLSGANLQTRKDQLITIKYKIKQLEEQFANNLIADNTTVKFTKLQLNGLPALFLKNRKTIERDGKPTKWVFTLKYPDYNAIMSYVASEDVRRKMLFLFQSLCADTNMKILLNLVKFRAKEANLLGFKSHAEMILTDSMAGSPSRVYQFLDTVYKTLDLPAKNYILWLKKFKTVYCILDNTKEPVVYEWDCQFLKTKMSKIYNVDFVELSKFFKTLSVVDKIIGIYQKLLGLRFEKVDTRNSNLVWHEDVLLYSVYNSFDDNYVGKVYLDLFVREHKYGHYASQDIRKRFMGQDNIITPPIVLVLTSFERAKNIEDSCIGYQDIVPLFHEFGHAMHEITSLSPWHIFSGTSVKHDFVEAPSQMMENWFKDPETLVGLSSHSINAETARSMISAAAIGKSLEYCQRLYLAIVDMRLHDITSEVAESLTVARLQNIWNEEAQKYLPFERDNNSIALGRFEHMIGGYSGRYYGYLWSRAYALDMFEQFKKNGLFDKTTSTLYRNTILAPGGTIDPDLLFRKFTGRELDMEPLLTDLKF